MNESIHKREDMKKRKIHNIIITGATSGIGLSCVKICCSNGHRVFGVSRRGVCDSYSNELFSLYKMDVTSDESVTHTIAHIQKDAISVTGLGIDAIIHCAGYGIAGSAEDTPLKWVKEQFETNYFGVLRVNSVALPLLRLHKSSKVIILGSIAGRISIPFQSHYSATKFALEAYVEALRMEGKHLGVQVSIIEAGDTATPFTAHRSYYAPLNSPYTQMGKKAVAKMEKDELNGYSPKFVAQVVYKVLIHKNPPPRKVVGMGYKILMILKRILPDRVIEKILRSLYL